MGSLVDHVRAKLLHAMYRSVDRMNDHILRDNYGGVVSEQELQKNLRSNFEEMDHGGKEKPADS